MSPISPIHEWVTAIAAEVSRTKNPVENAESVLRAVTAAIDPDLQESAVEVWRKILPVLPLQAARVALFPVFAIASGMDYFNGNSTTFGGLMDNDSRFTVLILLVTIAIAALVVRDKRRKRGMAAVKPIPPVAPISPLVHVVVAVDAEEGSDVVSHLKASGALDTEAAVRLHQVSRWLLTLPGNEPVPSFGPLPDSDRTTSSYDLVLVALGPTAQLKGLKQDASGLSRTDAFAELGSRRVVVAKVSDRLDKSIVEKFNFYHM